MPTQDASHWPAPLQRGLDIQPADILWSWEPGSNPRPAYEWAGGLASGRSHPSFMSNASRCIASKPSSHVPTLSSISQVVLHPRRPCEAAACTQVGMTLRRFYPWQYDGARRRHGASYLLVLFVACFVCV